MAIAVVSDQEFLDSPWPRPRLRLVEPLAPDEEPLLPVVLPVPEAEEEAWSWDDVGPAPALRWVPEPSGRAAALRRPTPAGSRRAQMVRRRVVLGLLAVGLLVALAAPVSALAGKPVAPGRAAPVPRVHDVVYTVRPGDSLRSVAARLSPGPHSASLARALAAQLGTERIVPGERLVLP